MRYKQEIKANYYATNNEGEGLFLLRGGAYIQLRGTSQTPKFKDEKIFRRYVLAYLRGEK